MRDHLENAPRNTTYTSPDIQNQVINILGDYVRQKILSKVRAARFFTVIADEVTDCSNKEQLSLVLRQMTTKSEKILLISSSVTLVPLVVLLPRR